VNLKGSGMAMCFVGVTFLKVRGGWVYFCRVAQDRCAWAQRRRRLFKDS